MKNLKKYRKQIKIGVIALLVILLLSSIWLFIVPSFKSNKYGDRLKDIEKHKISDETIKKIKDKASSSDSVSKINYNKEGRILNFTIIVDSNFGADQAKEFAGGILGEIKEDDQKYYDVQFYIDSNDKSDVYPIIGYKNKNSDKIVFGNEGA